MTPPSVVVCNWLGLIGLMIVASLVPSLWLGFVLAVWGEPGEARKCRERMYRESIARLVEEDARRRLSPEMGKARWMERYEAAKARKEALKKKLGKSR